MTDALIFFTETLRSCIDNNEYVATALSYLSKGIEFNKT